MNCSVQIPSIEKSVKCINLKLAFAFAIIPRVIQNVRGEWMEFEKQNITTFLDCQSDIY